MAMKQQLTEFDFIICTEQSTFNTVSNDTIHILMTGAGAPGAPGILKCLQQDQSFRVHLADADPMAVGRFLGDEFSQVPKGDDPAFTDSLFELCTRLKIKAVLPLVTRELLPLAYAADRFEKAGIKILISPAPSIEIANNKSALYQFLQWRDIPVPAFRVVETIEQFQSAIKELGYPANTVCFKPSISNGSRGFRIISSTVNEAELLFNYKPGNAYASLDDITRILSSAPFPELLVSEYLPGDEYSVDCLSNHGEPGLILPRLRKKMIGGISVQGEFVQDQAITDYCWRIIRELKLHGNTGIQVKKSSKGEWLVLEINPRVQGSIAACLGAGVNLPLVAVRQELGLPVTINEDDIRWGTGFSSYRTEVFY
jgi:carbamoyl-phosphate synthase large subunit